MRKLRPILILSLLLPACRPHLQVTPAHAEVQAPIGEPLCISRQGDAVCLVSFIHLLAHPEKYHQKKIQIMGYARFEFEGNALYFSADRARHGDMSDALWLDVTNMRMPAVEGWVLVEGTFNGERRGHFGMYSGTLENIVRLERSR
jgi:hypothetical protein